MSNSNLLCEYNLLKKIYGQNPLMMLEYEIVNTLGNMTSVLRPAERIAVQNLLDAMSSANAHRAKLYMVSKRHQPEGEIKLHYQSYNPTVLSGDLQDPIKTVKKALELRLGEHFEFPDNPHNELVLMAAFLCTRCSSSVFHMPAIGKLFIHMTSFQAETPDGKQILDADNRSPLILDNPLLMLNHMLELRDKRNTLACT